MPAAESPRVPVLLTAESIGVPLPAAGKGGQGVQFGEVHCDTPIAIPSPAPPERGRRDWRCWLLFICLRGTAAWEAEGRLGDPLAMRTCRSAGRDTRPADQGGAGQGHPGQRGREQRPGAAPCTCALPRRGRRVRPCTGRVRPRRCSLSSRAGKGAHSGLGSRRVPRRATRLQGCLRDGHVRPHRPKVTAAGPASRYGPH